MSINRQIIIKTCKYEMYFTYFNKNITSLYWYLRLRLKDEIFENKTISRLLNSAMACKKGHFEDMDIFSLQNLLYCHSVAWKGIDKQY